MQIPSPSLINGHHLPYVIVSDEIFALTQWLMKPFPGKHLKGSQAVFTYRLSQASRTIGNCFGILVTRWSIFRSPSIASPEAVDNITMACTCLHNYLRLTKNPQYLPSRFIDSEDSTGNTVPGNWRAEVQGGNGAVKPANIGRTFHRTSLCAKEIREMFHKYFNGEEGSLPWQKSHIESCGETRYQTITYEKNNTTI